MLDETGIHIVRGFQQINKIKSAAMFDLYFCTSPPQTVARPLLTLFISPVPYCMFKCPILYSPVQGTQMQLGEVCGQRSADDLKGAVTLAVLLVVDQDLLVVVDSLLFLPMRPQLVPEPVERDVA